jgi:VCBS repeat-containing protein
MTLSLTGQLWFVTQGNTTDARLEYINNDNSGNTVLVDNSPTTDLVTGFPEDVQVDWAAGVYFVLVNGDPAGGTGGRVLMGHVGSTAAPTVVYQASDLTQNGQIINAIQLDQYTHHLYVDQAAPDLNTNNTGILDFTYTPATVTPLVLTPVATNNGYLVKSSQESGIPNNATVGGVPVFDPRDFALDVNTNTLFFVNETDGTVNTNEIYRLNLSSPNTITPLLQQSQFPTPPDGNTSAFTNGYISGVEVDPSTGLVYFTTHSQHPSPDATYNSNTDIIYWISETASGSTAASSLTITAGAFSGLVNFSTFYPNHMTFDLANRQLYVETEQTDNGTTASSQDDAIYVLQLDASGHTATVVNVIHPSPAFSGNADNISGLTFDSLPTLGALSQTTTHAVEQSTSVTLLTAQPTITDIDGDHLASATVRITGGTFSTPASDENSTSDDHLSELSSGLSGTNITASYNSATETLTLSGYDTFAHYRQALAGVQYNTTGDNPTNYGLNTSRTITFQANDGAGGNPAGTTNVQTMSLNIDAVNDAPSFTTSDINRDEADAGLSSTVNRTITDPDSLSQTISTSLVSHTGPTNGISDATLATFFSAGTPVGTPPSGATGTLSYTFNSGTEAFNYLHQGEQLAITYNIHDVDSADTGTSAPIDRQVVVTITGTNDAPTVIGGTSQALTAGTEDTAPAGQTVSSLLGSHFSDVDDNASLAAVAIVSNGTSTSGTWQRSTDGSSWTNIGTASDASAVLVHTASFLRFLPAANFNGTAPSLSVRLVDDTQSSFSDGATANVSSNGGTTPYSTGTVSLTESVTAVNDAPAVVGGTTSSLTAINEDAANPSGQTVSALYSGHFDDSTDNQTANGGSSPNTFAGVAVTGNAATASQGLWQYSTDGTNWTSISTTLSDSSALQLDPNAFLRFVPATNFNGPAPNLTVRLIEDSIATPVTTGDPIDVSSNGGTSSFSAQTITTSETINAVNDAPTVVNGNTEALAAIDEDTANPAGTLISSVYSGHFSDAADSVPGGSSANTLAGIAVSANAATAAQGTWQWSTDGTTWNNISTSVSDTSALVLASTTQIRFVPATDFNGTAPSLTSHLIDNSAGAVTNNSTVNLNTTGTGGTTRYSTATVALSETINPVNDIPVVTPSGTTPTYTELQAGVAVDSTIAVSDVDSANLLGATVTIFNPVTGDELRIGGLTSGTIDNGASGTITYSFSGSTLTLSGTDTVADYQSALRSVTFDSISHDPTLGPNTSRTINWQVDDGGSPLHASAVANSSVTVAAVNDAPTASAPASYSGTPNVAVTINGLTFGDVDAEGASEVVTFTVAGGHLDATTGGNVTIGGTGTGTLTATGTIADLNTRFGTGTNNLTFTGTTSQTLGIDLNDAGHTGSGPIGGRDGITSAQINLNQPPTLGVNTANATFTESASNPASANNSPVHPISDATPMDPDGDPIAGATVTISSGFLAGDVLSFTPNGTITGTYDAGTHALTLTGSGDYSIALISVTYTSTSENPTSFGTDTSRTISYTVSDGSLNSNPATATLTVAGTNDAPTVVASPGISSYTENQAAVAVDPGVTVSDVDNTTLASATVSITGNFHAGEDVLAFTAGPGTGNIAVQSYAGGVLTLVSSGQTATLAQWQTALDSVTYRDTSQAPNTSTRTIAFQVSDGSAVSPSFSAGGYNALNAGLTSGDFNNDGAPDLVTISGGSSVYRVQINDGAGGFPSGTNYFRGASLTDALAADIDGDGNVDLLLSDNTYGGVFVLPGNGTGTFGAPTLISTGTIFPDSVAFRDVNEDGRPDLVVVGSTFSGTGGAAVLLGNGDGTFGSPIYSQHTQSDAVHIQFADLNEDGHLDLVTEDFQVGGFTVFFGNGDGTFGAPQNFDTGFLSSDIAVGDFNGDHHTDVAISQYNNTFSVLLGNGNGTFAAPLVTTPVPAGTALGGIVATDVNGDGLLDLAVSVDGTNQLAVLTGNGNGTFASPLTFSTSTGPGRVIANDLNHDGRLDLAVVDNAGFDDIFLNTNTASVATRQVSVTSVNDAPSASAPAAHYHATEQTDLALQGSGLSVSDVDGGSGIETVTLKVGEGIITIDPGNSNVTGLTNNGTSSVSFSGTIAQLNALLGGSSTGTILYNDNTDTPSASTQLSLGIDDNGNTGGGSLTGSASATIDVTAVNDAPEIGGAGNTVDYTEQNAAILVDDALTVSDVDSANLAGATVSITDGLQAGDTLHFSNQNGINFVSYTGGVLTLSGSSSVANYQAALESVTFDNTTNDNPTNFGANTTRTVTWQVDDGSGSNNLSNAPTSTITITPVNDAPVIGGVAAVNTAYTEQASAVAVDNGVTVTDADSTNLVGATVSITGGLQAGDTLHFSDQNGISLVSYTGGVLTLSGSSSVANYQTALASVTFDNLTNDDPTNGGANTTRTVTWQVDDGSGSNNLSNAPTSTITITAVDDGPANSVPGAQSVNEDTSLVFSSAHTNAISTSDPDNASGTEQVTLSVGHGALTLSQTTGLAFLIGDGTADSTMTFTGTVANVNAALNGLSYLGDANYNGPDSLSILTSDRKNTGTGGPLTDQSTVAITVNAVNDLPVLSGLGDTPSFVENGSPVVLDTNSNASVSDVELDVSASNYSGATLTLARNGGANPDDVFGSVGSLDLTDVAGNGENVSLDGGATFIGTFTQQDGTFSITFNANATAADVDSVMRQISYQNTSDNPPASAQIDFRFDDGNGEIGGQAQGSGGAGVTTASVTVAITQVDDPPQLLNVAPTAAYSPGSPGAVLSPALGVFDPDATPPSPLQGIHGGTVQIASGLLAGDELFVNLASSGGHFVTPDNVTTNISGSYAAGTLMLSGTDTVQDYQAVLDAVSYRSTAADPSNGGTDPNRTITWTVNDGVLSSQTPGPDVNETILHFDVAPTVDLDSSSPGTGFTTTYTTSTPPIAIVNNDTISDPDTANLDGLTVVLTNAQAGDALSIAGALPGGISSSVDTSVAGQVTVRLTNSASLADYQTALGQIRFANSNPSPNLTDRDITVVASEGEGITSNTAHATVHIVDATAPVQPQAPDLTNATDSGVSQTDNITNVTAPNFTGNVEPGTTVRLYDSDGTTVLGTAVANGQTGAYTLTSSALGQGTHHVTVTATDASNNTSIHSAPLDVTIDTTAPTPTLTAADGTTTFRNRTVHYTLSFPETTFGVDASDFTLTTTGGTTGAAITGVSEPGGPGTPYTISVSTGTGLGTVQLSLNSSGTGITDTAGNAAGGASGPAYAITNRRPTPHNDYVTLSAAQNALSGNVLANDSDPDGDALRVTSVVIDFLNGQPQTVAVPASGSVTVQSNHGALTIAADGSYSFTANDTRPIQNHYADDPFIYSVSDGNGGTENAQLNINLAGQQRPGTETFNFNFVNSTVTYGADGEAFLTGPDGVIHNVTGVGRLIFNDGQINEADGSPLVDDLYYDSQYRDVYSAGIDPEAHYAANGWHEGRNPDPYFNTNSYLSQNPDVAAAGVNPLTHYDTFGWHEGRNPGPNFNTTDYELSYPDVAAAGVDPLAHYLAFGELENRVTFPANAGTDGPTNGFDPTYYLANNPDVAAAGVNPLQHYLQNGWHEGRNPSADFNTNFYESHNPDVAAAGIDPLIHYDQTGWHEGRDPSAVFSTAGYLQGYSDVAAAGVNPLQHFLQFGMAEGRNPQGV